MSDQEEDVKRSYQVTLEVVSTHTFVVDEVNSPEEAEDEAQAWFHDGEEGEIETVEITNVDCFPVDLEEEEIN